MTKHIDHLLPAYVSKQLSADVTDHVKQHLAECEHCRASLEAYEALQDDLRFSLTYSTFIPQTTPAILWSTIDQERRKAPDRHIAHALVPRIVIGLLGLLMLVGVPCIVYNGITLPFEAALQAVETEVDDDMEIMTPKAPESTAIAIDDVRGQIDSVDQEQISARGTIMIDTPQAKPVVATPMSTRQAVNVVHTTP